MKTRIFLITLCTIIFASIPSPAQKAQLMPAESWNRIVRLRTIDATSTLCGIYRTNGPIYYFGGGPMKFLPGDRRLIVLNYPSNSPTRITVRYAGTRMYLNQSYDVFECLNASNVAPHLAP